MVELKGAPTFKKICCYREVLLGRPTLKDFKINICNGIDSWEFERKTKVTQVSPRKFVQEISSTARVFAVRIAFRPCEEIIHRSTNASVSLVIKDNAVHFLRVSVEAMFSFTRRYIF